MLARKVFLCRCVTLVSLSSLILWPQAAHSQNESGVFEMFQQVNNLLYSREADAFNTLPVSEKTLDLARQALRQPSASLRQLSPEHFSSIENFSPHIATEFVRDSQIKAAQGDWIGAMNARLDALELAVKLEASARFAGNAGILADKLETLAMKDIYPLASHLSGTAAQVVALRLDSIEAERPVWIDLLERNRADNLRSVEAYFGKSDWKERIVRESVVEHFVGIDPYGPSYSGVTIGELKDVSAPMLKSQVEEFWEFLLERERRPATATRPVLGFKLHEAAVFLLTSPDSNSRTAFFTSKTQSLLLSCALKLKAIREKTGTYPSDFKTPIDPFGDGKPLPYWPIGRSYRLYSVGRDGYDDGAKTALSRLQGRWPDDLIPPLFETTAREN